MPSVRTSEDDTSVAVQQQFALLLKGRARPDLQGDDLLQAFQNLDKRSKGYISSKSDVIDIVCDALVSKYQRRVDFNMIFQLFRTKHGRFDYTAFCEEFEKHRAAQEPPTQQPDSPSKRERIERRAMRSPLKSPHKRSNWLIEQQQQHIVQSSRDPYEMSQSIRLDPRLETQRLLSQSIRRKLLAGVIGAEYDGFKGIQELLFMLDEGGVGCIEGDVFEAQLLRRLRKPLTKQETQFLLTNLRVRTDLTSSADSAIHYEHLATFCSLDSDASADETDDQTPATPHSLKKSASNGPSDQTQSLGGAEFLAAVKRLKLFFQSSIAMQSDNKHTSSDTPRSVPTGAEAFLELAEAIDTKRAGFMGESEFSTIFGKLRLDISPGLVRAMLESFPRSLDHKVNYRAFLERYGENPELARDRRKLKQVLTSVLSTTPPHNLDPWFQYLTHRFEKYDTRLHKRPRGDLPQEEFVHVLRGSTSPVKLPVDTATSIATQFLCISRSSRIDAIVYREFLMLLRDCRVQMQAPTIEKVPTSTSATSKPSTSSGEINVADYLIHDATDDERQHFELLMDALHKFQQRIMVNKMATCARVSDAPRTVNPPQPRPSNNVESLQQEEPSVSSSSPRVGEIQPIDNGILLALGNKLQVRIQFAVANANLADNSLLLG